MPTVSIAIAARPEDVVALLRQAEVYPRWIVGTRRIVDVEDGWPVPGTAFHHEVGVGPLRLRDRTRMVADEGERIVLDARAMPLGRARVELRVRAAEGGSSVELSEEPVGGPARFIPRLLLDPATRVRNQHSLERLRTIAEEGAG